MPHSHAAYVKFWNNTSQPTAMTMLRITN